MINYVIHSKECKDKRSNKHYHSVIILKNDIHLMIGTPFTEGGGIGSCDFLHTAIKRMKKEGWIPENISLRDVIMLSHSIVQNNCKIKEVKEWSENK